MTKIAFFTSSRSEYGILKPLIKQLKRNNNYKIYLFIGGTHLSKSFGFTKKEILKDKIKIDDFFDYINNSSINNLNKSFINATDKTNNLFIKYKFDYTCILGDRLELLSIIINSLIYNKKIIHIGGGDTTEGAMDNIVRNMVSVSSFLHLVLIKNHKNKLIKMNVNKNKIFVVGSLAIDTIKSLPKISKKKFFQKMKLNIKLKTVVFSFHPSSSDFQKIKNLSNFYEEILKLLLEFNLQVIISYPGHEFGSKFIIDIIKKYEIKKNKHLFIFKSIGIENYNYLLKFSNFIIGNSSSGIIEAPYHNTPTLI